MSKKVCLIVIDGWGISQSSEKLKSIPMDTDLDPSITEYDAIAKANTPYMSRFLDKDTSIQTKRCPKNQQTTSSSTILFAHGLSVGLPDNLMGNSEVGHLNIGAGRIVYQDIVKIDKAIEENKLLLQENLKDFIHQCKSGTRRLHLIGLISDGGVHSHIRHLFALLKLAKESGIPTIYIHFIADGRDTSPKSCITYIKMLYDFIKTHQLHEVQLATLVGRYYAMDRDNRWERIQLAFDAFTLGKGDILEKSPTEEETKNNLIEKIDQRYLEGETDEFLKPIILKTDGTIKNNDSVLFFNYRSDRMRQIVSAFIHHSSPLETETWVENLNTISMTQYKEEFPMRNIFPPQNLKNVLAEWISKQGFKQCHIAETEKYAHVTFFFNGGREVCFKDEDRVLIPSPKVATYDLCPEMSCIKVAESMVEKLELGDYPFIMCNLAPPDMVGHTGKFEATVLAVEATDKAIGIIYEACKKNHYCLMITSDHGNAEKMKDAQGHPHTAHTTAPVPLILTNSQRTLTSDVVGSLCDVAPTLLDLMDLTIPSEMTGRSLLLK